MIRLFADTASNLPVALNKKYNVNIIELSYTVDGVLAEYDLEHDFDGKAFYDAMRNGAEMKTSMINSATFYDRFEEYVKNGDEIVYINQETAGESGVTFPAFTAAWNKLTASTVVFGSDAVGSVGNKCQLVLVTNSTDFV